MSIISEALKKANAEKISSAGAPGGRGRAPRNWGSSVLVLALLVLPFALPRLLDRSGSQDPANRRDGGRPAAADGSNPLPLADLPQTDSGVGLAQVAVESGRLPVAPAVIAAPISGPGAASTSVGRLVLSDRKLQGIVWTEDKGYYAILDGNVVREGAKVDSLRVTKITPMGVLLSDGSQDYFIEKSF